MLWETGCLETGGEAKNFQYMCLCVVYSVHVLQRPQTHPWLRKLQEERNTLSTCRVSGTVTERIYYRIGACVRKVWEGSEGFGRVHASKASLWTASRQETGDLGDLSTSYLKGAMREKGLMLGSRSSSRSY